MFFLFVILLLTLISIYHIYSFRAHNHLLFYFITTLFLSVPLSNIGVSHLLSPTDAITLTPIHPENNETYDVILLTRTVDGILQENTAPLEGNWMWTSNNQYLWRPPSDDRRPYPLSDSITLSLPYGSSRTLAFLPQDIGEVLVELNDFSIIVDLTAPTGGWCVLHLPATDDTTLRHLQYLEYLLWLLLFTALQLFFWLLALPELKTSYQSHRLLPPKNFNLPTFLKNNSPKNQKSTNLYQSLQKLAFLLFHILFALLFFYLTALSTFSPSSRFIEFFLKDIALYVPLCYVSLLLLLTLLDKLPPFYQKLGVFINLSLLLYLQLLFATNLQVAPDWDFGVVMEETYRLLTSENINQEVLHWYYYRCPNNLGILYTLLSLLSQMNLPPDLSYYAFYHYTILLNILFVQVSLLMTLYLIRRYTNLTITLLSSLAFLVITPFFSYTTVIYTDTIGMLFPILAFFLFQLGEDSKSPALQQLFRLFTIFTLVFGYYIKGSVGIFLIALLITLLCKETFPTFLKHTSLLFLYGLMALATYQTFVPTYVNKELALPATHYIAMGAGYGGDWNEEDYAYTTSLLKEQTYSGDEIARLNWEKYLSRLETYGLDGYLQFLHGKMRRTWNDGSYHAPNKLATSPLTPETPLYQKVVAENRDFLALSQFSHILLLLGIALSYKKTPHLLTLLQIGIFGNFLFLLLWETRSRYLVCLLPVMVLLSAYGYHQHFIALKEKLNSLKSKKKS